MGISTSDYHAMLRRCGQNRNPGAVALDTHTTNAAPGIRIRQDSKPLMNKLEKEWFSRISGTERFNSVRAQSKRFKLGNGIWFKPDATAIDTMTGTETAWEVKGPHAFRGGFENLKVAAGIYPEIEWVLVWKENGNWKVQRVLS